MQVSTYTLVMRLADLVRTARESRGWSPAELSRRAKVDPSTVLRIERGESLGRSDTVAKLAHVLEIEPQAIQSVLAMEAPLLSREDELPPLRPRSPADILRELETAIREQGPIMVYPAADQVISAGQGAPLAEPIAYYPRPGERGHRFTWVKVVGTCMEPEIKDGSIAIVDEDASAHPGNIVAAIHDGEALVKRLERHDGELYLVALRDRPAVKVDADTHIIGVVTFTGKWV